MTEAERIERAAEAMRSSQPWSSFWSLDDARLLARAAITAYLGEEAQGYADSLRQQAKWIDEAVNGHVPIHARLDLGDIDTDELRAAANLLFPAAEMEG